MEIRKIHSGETSTIWRLFHDTVHCINQADYSERALAVMAPDKYDEPRWVSRFIRTQPLVAMDDNVLLGVAELGDDGRIDMFYVHHQHQGEGIGRALMQRLKAEAASRGLSRLYCETSISARPFFEKMGFVSLEQREQVRHGQAWTVILMESKI